MNNLLRKPPMGQKPARTGRNPAHLAKVGAMPCCICEEYGLDQITPTQVHHVICGRHSTRRAPDEMTIPLCEGCHQGNFDTTKIAIHRDRAEWVRRYGADTEWLNWVTARLEQ